MAPMHGRPLAWRAPLHLFVLVLVLAPARAQQKARPACPAVQPPPAWISGDTHGHVQACDGVLDSEADVLAEMRREDMRVSSLLIWNPKSNGQELLPFTEHVCRVTGVPEPGTGSRVLQYGVETSGLDCAEWAHVSALNIGSSAARIAVASEPADCYTSPTGLGLGCPGGDGTGHIPGPVARHFGNDPDALRGIGQIAWPVALYSPLGYDWRTELLLSGTTTDALCLDQDRILSFPNIFAIPNHRQFFSGTIPVDVVLGDLDYVETGDMAYDYTFTSDYPVSRWYGMVYRLWNAGLRVTPTAGSDRGCVPGNAQVFGPPRTWALVEGPLTYDSWIDAIRNGRVSLSMGKEVFLELEIDGEVVGSQIDASAPATVTLDVTLHGSCGTTEVVQILQNGVVVATRTLRIPFSGGVRSWQLALPLSGSAWIAAKLRSNRAHTGPSWVTVDDQPIASCEDAEYWMMWCDSIGRRVGQAPPGTYFGCQDAEFLADVAVARNAFLSLRDHAHYNGGFDPTWNVQRHGASTPACCGPITAGITARASAGQAFTLTCLNAPPNASGQLYLSAAAQPATCVANVSVLIDPLALLPGFPRPVTSFGSGYAQTIVDEPGVLALPAGTVVHAQYMWNNTAACPGGGCDGNGSALSASDALAVTLH